MISKEQLHEIMPFATGENLEKFTDPLNETMVRFEINTPQRIACFLAQLAHESGSLKYTREIASGAAYEGRKDLGNTQSGDGIKFKGRGLIQLTGRANYQALTDAFGVDFVANPELLEGAVYASMSAGWFWKKKGLNELADKMDFTKITKRVNGGLNGLVDRMKYFELAKKTLGI